MIRRAFLKAFGTAILGLALTKTLPGIGGTEAPAIPEPLSHVLRVGDVVTFEGDYAVNPPEMPQQFMVTAVEEHRFTAHPGLYGQPDSTWRLHEPR